MIKIENTAKDYCNSCGSTKDLFTLTVSRGKDNLAISIHLCKSCCKTLNDLLGTTQIKGIKMCSIEELDEIK